MNRRQPGALQESVAREHDGLGCEAKGQRLVLDALFRTTRIFADLTVMRDTLRVLIHLDRKLGAPYFIKIAQGDKRVSHVALVRTAEDLRTIMPLLREAFDLAVSEDSSNLHGTEGHRDSR